MSSIGSAAGTFSVDQFQDAGFTVVKEILTPSDCERLAGHISALRISSVGTRNLMTLSWCKGLAERLREHSALRNLIPRSYVAAQCTYFEKSLRRNWLVPMHQDLSIPVARRVAHTSLRGWSEKEGSIFVQPPTELLDQVLAVRVHVDACALEDGPLVVVPGSHRYGRLTNEETLHLRGETAPVPCTLGQGDVLAMRPLLLHRSSKASGKNLRRLLHFVFGPNELPFGLTWKIAV